MSTSQADKNLWAAYGAKLLDSFALSSNVGPNNRLYIAPLSAAGIAAGKNINEAITNMGILNVADTLLDLESPVFMPTRQSYAKRAQQYVNSVYLNADKNTGAQMRYNNARDDMKQATQDYNDTLAADLTTWKEQTSNGLTTVPFYTWAASNAPDLASAQKAKDTASATLDAATKDVGGENAAIVGKISLALNSATGQNLVTGFTMNVSATSASQVTNPAPTNLYLAPAYNIDNQYAQSVDGWINTFPQNKGNPKSINFNASDASDSTWKKLGFSSETVNVEASYCIFFSCTYTENRQTVTQTMTAEQAGSELSVTITATGWSTFKVNPSNAWNPSQLWDLPLDDAAPNNLRKPAAYVNQALLAYGVGMEVNMSANTSKTINDWISKASKSGGYATVFGYNIGLGGDAASTQSSTSTWNEVTKASSSTTLKIPADDNGYPTLLAVLGTALPLPPPSN